MHWLNFRFPPVHKYQFAEPNSTQNIVFEDKEKAGGGSEMIKVLILMMQYLIHVNLTF